MQKNLNRGLFFWKQNRSRFYHITPCFQPPHFTPKTQKNHQKRAVFAGFPRFFINLAGINCVDLRSHWANENHAHRSLDVALNVDFNRKRLRYPAINLLIDNNLGLNLINKVESWIGLKAKRLHAAWSDDNILKVLKIKCFAPESPLPSQQ